MQINFEIQPSAERVGSLWVMTVPGQLYDIEHALLDVAVNKGPVHRGLSYAYAETDEDTPRRFLPKAFPRKRYRYEVLREDLLDMPMYFFFDLFGILPDRDPGLPHIHYIAKYWMLPDPKEEALFREFLEGRNRS